MKTDLHTPLGAQTPPEPRRATTEIAMVAAGPELLSSCAGRGKGSLADVDDGGVESEGEVRVAWAPGATSGNTRLDCYLLYP